MRYSIVIVSFNCRKDLERCLESLDTCREETQEIIVVDNASKDGTPEMLEQRKDVIAILNDVNRGFSAACNQGAKNATGEFVIFLNPDTLVTPGWSRRMAAFFQSPNVGAVGPLSNYVAGHQKYEFYCAQRLTPSGGGTLPSQVRDLSSQLAVARAGKGVSTKLLIGFCMMMRRSLFMELGGMDEELFLGNDDLDISWRLRNKGLQLVVATDAFVYHEGQKCFDTQPKSHTTELVQASTDALYRKLIRYYGGSERVPSAMELWGIGWFTPSGNANGTLKQESKDGPMEKQKTRDAEIPSQKESQWPMTAHLVHIPHDSEHPQSELDRTLGSLPRYPQLEVVVLNFSSRFDLTVNHPGKIRKLDLGPDCAPWQALHMAHALISRPRILACRSGIRYTALFNAFIENCPETSRWQAALLPGMGGESDVSQAFMCGKGWLKDKLYKLFETGTDIWEGLAGSLANPSEREKILFEKEIPRLEGVQNNKTAPKAIENGPSGDWGAVETEKKSPDFSAYPSCLRIPLEASRMVAFLGTQAGLVNPGGKLEGFDAHGRATRLENQDLLVVRITEDWLEGLALRLRYIRGSCKSLQNIIGIVKSAPGMPAIAAEQRQAALSAFWEAGFAVTKESNYSMDAAGGREAATPDENGLLIEAIPRSANAGREKKVSIIILGFNQVEYTRKCIESIRANTRQQYELILIDNGSEDGTEAFFRSVPGAKVIRNQENLGVARGWNQGLAIADGEYLLIFNNDTLVGPGWLENMVALAESHPSVGIVGPRSNNISGPQLISSVPYTDEPGMYRFAQIWQEEHRLQARPFERITGFCMLISREAFDRIGPFDERYGKGNFEDDDYCLRARYHGYRLMIADDSFVHHYGSVSFRQAKVDWHALMEENRIKFEQKWSRGRAALDDIHKVPTSTASGRSTNAAELSGAQEGTESRRLCAEAKQAYQRAELEDAQKLYLDAVSKDPACGEGYNGLGIIRFHQRAHADAVALFKQTLRLDPRDRDAAWNMTEVLRDYCQTEDGVTAALEQLTRDFPDNEAFREALASSGSTHWLVEAEELLFQKRYEDAERLAGSMLESQPVEAMNFLGVLAHHQGDFSSAWNLLKEALASAPGNEDILLNLCEMAPALQKESQLWPLLEKAFPPGAPEAEDPGLRNKVEEYRRRFGKPAEKLDPGRVAMLITKGENLVREGLLDKAEETFLQVLSSDPESADARNDMGLIRWYQGRHEEAWRWFCRALELSPAHSDALSNVLDCALVLREADAMMPLLERALEKKPDHAEALRIRRALLDFGPSIYLAENSEELDRVTGLLRLGWNQLEKGDMSSATHSFLEVLEKYPSQAEALKGLGNAASRWGRHEEAYQLFGKAYERNPLDAPLLEQLCATATLAGKASHLKGMLESMLEKRPDSAQLKDKLLALG